MTIEELILELGKFEPKLKVTMEGDEINKVGLCTIKTFNKKGFTQEVVVNLSEED